MELVKFVFYMGVIQIVFSTIWKFVALSLSSLLHSIGLNKDFSFLGFKAVGYYILVSVSALVTWDAMEGSGAIVAALVGIAGTFIIYTTIAGNLERNRWRAVMNFERKRVQVMRFDGYLLISAVLLYLLSVAMPGIPENSLNEGFRHLIDQIYKTPLIGWIVGLGAFFYMVHIIFKGLKTTDYIIGLFFKPRTPERKDPGADEYDAEYIDYVEVRDQEGS